MRFLILILVVFSCFCTPSYAQLPTENVDSTEEEINYNPDENTVENSNGTTDLPQKSRYEESTKKYYSEDIKTNDFDRQKWQKDIAGLDYTIEEKKREKAEKKPSKNGENREPFRISPAFIFLIKWFFILGAVAIIAFFVYQFAMGGDVFGPQSKRVYGPPSVKIDLAAVEENLLESELDPLIRQAINNKQFSLAVRLYYLTIIKELSNKGSIVWKKDKTNRTYVREMNSHKLSDKFKQITTTFERIWYGDSTIDEATFLKIQPNFKDLLKQI